MSKDKGLDLPNSDGWWWYKSQSGLHPVCIKDIKNEGDSLSFTILQGDSVTKYWDLEHRLTGKLYKAILP